MLNTKIEVHTTPFIHPSQYHISNVISHGASNVRAYVPCRYGNTTTRNCPVQFTAHNAVSTSTREIQGDSDNGAVARPNCSVENVVGNVPLY